MEPIRLHPRLVGHQKVRAIDGATGMSFCGAFFAAKQDVSQTKPSTKILNNTMRADDLEPRT